MEIKIKRKTAIATLIVFISIFSILTFYSCTYNPDDCHDIGAEKFIDSATVGGKEYTLLMRQTGFQDKIYSLLLYPHNIVFDSCGNPVGDEIDYEHIDYGPENSPSIQWPEKIEIKDDKIIIHYTKDEDRRKPIIDIPVIWHQELAK